ncbi:hypothetical protein LEP1GSC096_0011 [Leptospira interrogans serovar Hebdomadis str. R499]|nr:hypothetical protein LEP1GSC096_0011 [Leptospira interrogans serovar Hebdomadis str. R499]
MNPNDFLRLKGLDHLSELEVNLYYLKTFPILFLSLFFQDLLKWIFFGLFVNF